MARSRVEPKSEAGEPSTNLVRVSEIRRYSVHDSEAWARRISRPRSSGQSGEQEVRKESFDQFRQHSVPRRLTHIALSNDG